MNGKEFIRAVKNITKEKEIEEDIVFDAMEHALITSYKKNFDAKTNVKVRIDKKSGDIKVFSYYVVVDELIEEEVYDDEELVEEESSELIKNTEEDIEQEHNDEEQVNLDAQILLEDALKIKSDAKLGDVIEQEVTPKDFGRVAASTAKQVLTQKIREAERESILEDFSDKEDEMMSGTLVMEDNRNYYIELGRARGILPKTQIIPDEVLKIGSNVKVYIQKVELTTKGPLILCSRKHYGFIRRLFELEIPELQEGEIILHSVAREPGVRSKVAVFSQNPNIDPIGACIGERGSRITKIYNQLSNEKIDLILYSEDNSEFIKNALSPAKDVIINILDDEKERKALAIVNEDNLALAIGKKGINIKLASKLTKFHITIKSLDQITEEANRDD